MQATNSKYSLRSSDAAEHDAASDNKSAAASDYPIVIEGDQHMTEDPDSPGVPLNNTLCTPVRTGNFNSSTSPSTPGLIRSNRLDEIIRSSKYREKLSPPPQLILLEETQPPGVSICCEEDSACDPTQDNDNREDSILDDLTPPCMLLSTPVHDIHNVTSESQMPPEPTSPTDPPATVTTEDDEESQIVLIPDDSLAEIIDTAADAAVDEPVTTHQTTEETTSDDAKRRLKKKRKHDSSSKTSKRSRGDTSHHREKRDCLNELSLLNQHHSTLCQQTVDVERRLESLDSYLTKVDLITLIQTVVQAQEDHRKGLTELTKVVETLSQATLHPQHNTPPQFPTTPAASTRNEQSQTDDQEVSALASSLGKQILILEKEIDDKNNTISQLKKDKGTEFNNLRSANDTLQASLTSTKNELRALNDEKEEWGMMMSKRANELQQTLMEKYKLHQECAQLIEDNTKLVQRVQELESCSPQPHHDPKPLMQIPLQHEQQVHQQQRPQHPQQPQPHLQLKQGMNSMNAPMQQQHLPHKPPPGTDRKDPVTPDVDVIFYHDSLGKRVNKTLVKREGLFTTKVLAPRLAEVRKHIETVKKPPRLFVLHVGTNDLPNKDADEVLDELYDLVDKMRERFPTSKILLSALVTRTIVLKLQNKIDYINACLSIEYEDDPFVAICKHPGVGTDLLWTDGLHLKDAGTSKLSQELRIGIAKSLNIQVNKKDRG